MMSILEDGLLEFISLTNSSRFSRLLEELTKRLFGWFIFENFGDLLLERTGVFSLSRSSNMSANFTNDCLEPCAVLGYVLANCIRQYCVEMVVNPSLLLHMLLDYSQWKRIRKRWQE